MELLRNNGSPPRESTERDSAGLHRYGRLKLELAAAIRAVLDRARRRRDEEIENRARKLLGRLSEDRFYLAVVGQHKRGKSSLMNAMIGRELLPTGILPVTSAIVALGYDSDLKIEIRLKSSSRPLGIRLDELRDYVSEQGNPGNRKQVESAEVGVPAELLRYGFYFVDTPGIGSAIAANTATTEEFLPEADAAIFVTSFESPMNELELGFLDKVRQYVHKMFFVVNKSDLASPEDREQVAAFVRERIAEHTGKTGLKIYIVSAMRQMAAGRATLGENSDAGMEELRSDLQSYLVKEKAREFLLRIAERARDLLESERLENNLTQWTTRQGTTAVTADKVLPEIADQLTGQARQIAEKLRPEVAAALAGRLADRLIEFRSCEIQRVERELEKLFVQPRLFLPLFDLPDRFLELRRGLQADATRWIQENALEFDAAIHNVMAPQASILTRLRGSLLNVAAERLGVESQDARTREDTGNTSCPPGNTDPVSELPLRTPAQAPKFEWDWYPPCWCFIVPAPLVARWLNGKASIAFSSALSAYEKSISDGILAAGDRWIDELKARIKSSIEHRSGEIREMILARTPDGIQEVERQLAGLDAVAKELLDPDEKAARDLVTGKHAQSSNSIRLDACVVCRELIEALNGFFAKYQYELAVNESCQKSHADRGGFCPLHTWIYEGIASPQGMSAGYALTLERAGDRLRSIADSIPINRLPEEIEGVLSSEERCPACGMLANAQRASVASQSAAIQRGGRPPLCLPHMQRTVALLGDEQRARDLLRDRAAVLGRIAEDMRLFALKSEAFRHHLTVREEVIAYRKGLQQLVGEKNLSIARRLD